MLHLLLNLCAFCRLASRLAWDRRPCPAPAPAPARTAPARLAGETASRHGTRAARPAPCRRRAQHAQHPGQTDTPPPAAPMPPACPPRSNSQSQQENARTSEEGEEEHEGRKGEKVRTCARLPAVLPSKSYINRTPPPNGQPSTAPGQQAPQPAPAEAPSLPTFSRPFLPLSILLLESLQNPGPFSPVGRRTTAPRPPAWTPPAPGEPSHFRARSVSHETAQYLHSITYAPYPHFSLGNNLDDSPTVNELNPYLQNHIFGLTTPVFLSTFYNSPRLQSYSSPIATKKTNILIDFRPQIW